MSWDVERLTEQKVAQLQLPTGASVEDVALGATRTLRVRDRAKVAGLNGAFQVVTNSGGVETDFGVESRLGSVISVASVVLHDRARADGSVTTAGVVTRGNGVVVTGQVNQKAVLSTVSLAVSTSFESGGEPITVSRGQARDVAPGRYGATTVYSGGSLTLRAGTYHLDSLALEPQGRFIVDAAAGPILIHVKSALQYRGDLELRGARDRLAVVYYGDAAVALERPFVGVFLAPSASVRLGTGGTRHSGAVFAKDIEVDPGVVFEHQPLGDWRSLFPGPPGSSETTPEDSIADALPDDASKPLVLEYLRSMFGSDSPTRRAYAIAALRSHPPSAMAKSLSLAFDRSPDPREQWALVQTAVAVRHAAMVPLLNRILTISPPSGFVEATADAHQQHLRHQGAILLRAVDGLLALQRGHVKESRAPLLAAVNHPLRMVRAQAIFRISQSGDAALIADMRSRVRPEDRSLLGLRRATAADISPAAPTANTFEIQAPSTQIKGGSP